MSNHIILTKIGYTELTTTEFISGEFCYELITRGYLLNILLELKQTVSCSFENIRLYSTVSESDKDISYWEKELKDTGKYYYSIYLSYDVNQSLGEIKHFIFLCLIAIKHHSLIDMLPSRYSKYFFFVIVNFYKARNRI